MPLLKRLLVSTLLVSGVVSGCASGKNKEPEVPSTPTPSDLSRLLPLKDRTVSNFWTKSDLGATGVLVLEYFRPRPDHAEIRLAGRVQHILVGERRISYTAGGTLLELPIEVGHHFPGSFGTVTITAIDQSLDVPGGNFQGCLTVVEESEKPPKRSTSTYCPDVGLVTLHVEAFTEEGTQELWTRLSYHGPRIDLSR